MISLNCTHGWGALLFWFILLTFFAFLVMYCLLPSFILKTGTPAVGVAAVQADIDYRFLLGYSVLVAVILLVIAYLITRY